MDNNKGLFLKKYKLIVSGGCRYIVVPRFALKDISKTSEEPQYLDCYYDRENKQVYYKLSGDEQHG